MDVNVKETPQKCSNTFLNLATQTRVFILPMLLGRLAMPLLQKRIFAQGREIDEHFRTEAFGVDDLLNPSLQLFVTFALPLLLKPNNSFLTAGDILTAQNPIILTCKHVEEELQIPDLFSEAKTEIPPAKAGGLYAD